MKIRDEGEPTRRRAKLETVGDWFDDTEDYEALLDDADRGAKTERAMDFVSQMRDRYEEYDDEAFLSEKQLAWLKSIAGEPE